MLSAAIPQTVYCLSRRSLGERRGPTLVGQRSQTKPTVKHTTPRAVLRNTEFNTSGLRRTRDRTSQGLRGQAPPCRDQAGQPQNGHMRQSSLETGSNPRHPVDQPGERADNEDMSRATSSVTAVPTAGIRPAEVKSGLGERRNWFRVATGFSTCSSRKSGSQIAGPWRVEGEA